MDRAEWLKSLRVGDEVAIDEGRYGVRWTIKSVKKVTPKGQFRVGHYLFNQHGACSQGAWDHWQIVPVTDEIIEWVRRDRVLSEVRNFSFASLTTDQLEQIWAVIKGES